MRRALRPGRFPDEGVPLYSCYTYREVFPLTEITRNFAFPFLPSLRFLNTFRCLYISSRSRRLDPLLYFVES